MKTRTSEISRSQGHGILTVFILSSAENSLTVFLFLTRKTNLEYIHSCKKLRGDNADYYAKKSYLWGNRKADLAALVITPSSSSSHTRAATSRCSTAQMHTGQRNPNLVQQMWRRNAYGTLTHNNVGVLFRWWWHCQQERKETQWGQIISK